MVSRQGNDLSEGSQQQYPEDMESALVIATVAHKDDVLRSRHEIPAAVAAAAAAAAAAATAAAAAHLAVG